MHLGEQCWGYQEPAQGVSHWLAAAFAAKPGGSKQPWGCQGC